MIISHTAEESHFTDNVAFSLWRGRPYRYIYFCKFLYNSPDSFLEILNGGQGKSFEKKFNI